MGLHADDQAAIAADLTATVDGLANLVKPATVAVQVERLGRRVLNEVQSTLRERYGVLPSPLTDELRDLVQIGIMAELMLMQARRMNRDEKTYPDEWRSRFERRLDALAAGVERLDLDLSDTSRSRTSAVASNTRAFTLDGVGRVLGNNP